MDIFEQTSNLCIGNRCVNDHRVEVLIFRRQMLMGICADRCQAQSANITFGRDLLA